MNEPQKRLCKECGRSFEPKTYHQKFCSEKCSGLYHMKMNRERRLKRKLESKNGSQRGKNISLTDIAVEARKAGMTYGEYVAKHGL